VSVITSARKIIRDWYDGREVIYDIPSRPEIGLFGAELRRNKRHWTATFVRNVIAGDAHTWGVIGKVVGGVAAVTTAIVEIFFRS
jgi:hypothetical protein